jgi:micrococcal nuclease
LIAIIWGILLTCYGLTFAFSNKENNETKVAALETISTSTETKIEITVTYASTATNTIAPTKTLTPIPTQTLAKLNSCLPDNAKVDKATVIKIVDGDTIDVDISGNQFTVRYIGIDTPETNDPKGPEATKRNTELIAGKQITLVKDVSEVDRYNRLLRYIFVGSVFVNETLVKEGYAYAKAYPPDTSCHDVFSAVQAEAKTKSLGLWLDTRTVKLPTPQAPVTSSESCPQGCLEQKPGCDIKGNINSDDVKIYHVPGGSSYSKTKIDPSKGERWFCTADEAVANGWRAPKN